MLIPQALTPNSFNYADVISIIISHLESADAPVGMNDLIYILDQSGYGPTIPDGIGNQEPVEEVLSRWMGLLVKGDPGVYEFDDEYYYLPDAFHRDRKWYENNMPPQDHLFRHGVRAHAEKCLTLLNNQSGVISWAQKNVLNKEIDVRYMAFTVLLQTNYADRYITKLLQEPHFRLKCLGIVNAREDHRNHKFHLLNLLKHRKYRSLVLSKKYSDLKIINTIAKSLKSTDEREARLSAIALMNSRSDHALVHLIEAFSISANSLVHYLGSDQGRTYFQSMATRKGPYNNETHSKLIELCSSRNPAVQTSALQVMYPRWAASDVYKLENLRPNIPFALRHYLLALYRIKAPNRLAIACEYLENENLGMRDEAVFVLGNVGMKDELSALLKLSGQIEFKSGEDDSEYVDPILLMESIANIKKRIG